LSVIGIIAEFNPLHSGHEYLIKEAKKQGTVIAVISGNFVQRGETAIAEKRIRALSALKCGADLVVEMPVLWSMSTAENFALGGVSILNNMGCDKLMFGSECGDIETLTKTADILLSDEFSQILSAELKSGITFASAREKACIQLGVNSEIVSKPNNNLAIEYIKASKLLGADFKFETVKRKGADHDSKTEDEFVSASLLREKLQSGDYNFCSKYISKDVLSLLKPENISDIKRIDRAILAVLRTKTLDELKNLPDISEGVENKLYNGIRLAETTEDLYNIIKVKRYTHARLRRLALSAFIGADNSFFKNQPPYIRVLGFNKTGEQQLRESAKTSQLPVVVRPADIKSLSAYAQKVFETECRATDLFTLSLTKPLPCGLEYTAKIIKTE
jgi:predicted nucleotidyltransferase